MNPLLSLPQIEALLSQRSISDLYPWNTENEEAVSGFYKMVCADICRATGVLSRNEWDHYGSGYASYIDAWFYKTSPEFNVEKPLCYGNEHKGLVVLLSRLSPFFVFMEAEKSWHTQGGSGYLPESEMIDRLPTKAIAALADQVQPILESYGLIRAPREALTQPLPPTLRVPTVLTDRAFLLFDALFYWED